MADDRLPVLRVYSRPGCHLCEQLVEALLPLVRGRAAVDVLDIDARQDWADKYGLRIPVVEFDGEFVCQYELDPDAIGRILDDLPASRAV